MALKPSLLKRIPQGNKDLAFGYLKEKEKEHNSNYPQLIKFLVLLYSNAQDSFDPDNTHQLIEIDGNCAIDVGGTGLIRNSYLKNVVTQGIHIWKFKYNMNVRSGSAALGVWKATSGNQLLSATFVDDTNKSGCINKRECTGYLITMEGEVSNPQDPSDGDHVKSREIPKK